MPMPEAIVTRIGIIICNWLSINSTFSPTIKPNNRRIIDQIPAPSEV